MEQHHFPPQSVPDAWDKGFIHDFATDPQGQMYCLAHPERRYSFSDYKAVGVIADASRQSAIILIRTADGLQGTRTDFWDL
jgi:hypothetical protein